MFLFVSASGEGSDEFDNIPVSDDMIDENSNHDIINDDLGSSFSSTSNDETVIQTKKTFYQLLLESGDISGKNNFFLEITFLCLVGLCVWSFMYGKITNRILAIKWVAVHKELFSEQFALISAASNAEPNPDELLSQDNGYNSYKFYASGRKSCSALLAEITLIKRNDVFWRIIDALAFPCYDKVTTQTVLTESSSCHPFLFFLCRKGKQVSIRDGNPFFKEFTSQMSVPSLSSDLVVFSEVQEVIDQVLSADDIKIINDLSDFVEMISITDLNTEIIDGVVENSPPKKVLTCTFRLPAPGYMDQIVPLTELSLRMIDIISSLKLSIGGKNKVDRNRKVLTDRVAKALAEKRLLEEKEENEKKKLEKLEKEKQEYEKLPSHLKVKRDREEEKKKKKEANKSMMKKKM